MNCPSRRSVCLELPHRGTALRAIFSSAGARRGPGSEAGKGALTLRIAPRGESPTSVDSTRPPQHPFSRRVSFPDRGSGVASPRCSAGGPAELAARPRQVPAGHRSSCTEQRGLAVAVRAVRCPRRWKVLTRESAPLLPGRCGHPPPPKGPRRVWFDGGLHAWTH